METKKAHKREWKDVLLYNFGIPFAVAIAFLFISLGLKFSAPEIISVTLLSFFVPALCVDILQRANKDTSSSYIERKHFIDEPMKNADRALLSILDYLINDCYNRCSNNSDHCADCPNFPNECNGLIRNYLYETCKNLVSAIDESKYGSYNLNTNIERFHTIAVDHLIGTKSKKYSVIQYVEHDAVNGLCDVTYDDLDYDFLRTLLSKTLTGDEPYYKIKDINFKIRWVFIGDINDMKNNFDYIFFIIKDMGLEKIVSEVFEFYTISQIKYLRQNGLINALTNFSKEKLTEKPSIGIFGNSFMFVDSGNHPEHGVMYTRSYKSHPTDAKGALDESLSFFEATIKIADKKDFSSFTTVYDRLDETHRKEVLPQREKKGK
jgi:hypothetical protein